MNQILQLLRRNLYILVFLLLEAIALVAGVDRIMDMARTSINVLGDAAGAVLVSRLENNGECRE